ncbi:MAG TPA: hypothetical protein VF983_06450 [Streptosporangiaceae bacterium]
MFVTIGRYGLAPGRPGPARPGMFAAGIVAMSSSAWFVTTLAIMKISPGNA